MAVALISGAFIGTAVSELLKAVKDAKNNISSFKPILESLESTLTTITPRLVEIALLNKKLNQSSTGGTTDLDVLIRDGKELVDKCSKISRLNIYKKGQYSERLRDLDCKLLRYFVTVLQLDQFKEMKKNQVILNKLLCKLGDLENNPEELVVKIKDEASSSNCDKTAMTREGRVRGAFSALEDGNQRAVKLQYGDNGRGMYTNPTIYLHGNMVSTKFVLYNATGDTVNLVRTDNWYVREPYPLQIENGQWGVYFHVATLPFSAFVGVVFRGMNLKDEYRDWMFLWVNKFTAVDVAGRTLERDNCVYTEIRQADHYKKNEHCILGLLSGTNAKKYTYVWDGCSSSVTTQTGTNVVVEAILTLKLD